LRFPEEGYLPSGNFRVRRRRQQAQLAMRLYGRMPGFTGKAQRVAMLRAVMESLTALLTELRRRQNIR
jgi:hypothetical protein